MDTSQLLLEVKAEIVRLQQVVALLEGSTTASKGKGKGKRKGKGSRPPMSAAARAKIAKAQKKRWAEFHKKQKQKKAE